MARKSESSQERGKKKKNVKILASDTKNCLFCRRYSKCSDPNKHFNYICSRFRSMNYASDVNSFIDGMTGHTEDEVNEFNYADKLRDKIGDQNIETMDASSALRPKSKRRKVRKSDDGKPKRQSFYESEIEAALDEFRHTAMPPDLMIDDRDLPRARNFLDFCGRNFLNQPPFARQLEMGIKANAEFCPRKKCTDLRYWDNVPVDATTDEILDRVTLLEFNVCPNCGKNKSELHCDYDLKVPVEMAALAGQRCVVGNTHILTQRGFYEMEELMPRKARSGKLVKYSNKPALVMPNGSFMQPTKFYYKDEETVYRVEMANGYHIEGRGEHPILTLDPQTMEQSYIQLKDLKKHTVIPISLGQNIWGEGRISTNALVKQVKYKPTDKLDPGALRMNPKHSGRLLRKLFSRDDCVSVGTYSMTYHSPSRRLINQISMLLHNFGIQHRIVDSVAVHGKGRQNLGIHIMGGYNLRAFLKHCGELRLKRHKNTINTLLKMYDKPYIRRVADVPLPAKIKEKYQEVFARLLQTLYEDLKKAEEIFVNGEEFENSSAGNLPDLKQANADVANSSPDTMRKYDPETMISDLEKVMSKQERKKRKKKRDKKTDKQNWLTREQIRQVFFTLLNRVPSEDKEAFLRDGEKDRPLTPIRLRTILMSLHQTGYFNRFPMTFREIDEFCRQFGGWEPELIYTEVKKVVKQKEKQPVYDVQVPEYNCFFGNGLVNHNSGKSAFARMNAEYKLHQYLKTPNVQQRFNLQDNQILHGLFVALTFDQAKELLWDSIYIALREAPWFKAYNELMTHYGNKYGMELFRIRDTYAFWAHRNLHMAPYGPDARKLRGRTPFNSACDEIGWFISSNKNMKVKIDGPEIYKAMRNGFLTLRSAYYKRLKRGEYDFPAPIFTNTSSPSSKKDMICTLYDRSQNSKTIIGFSAASWEMNPEFDENSEEFMEMKRDDMMGFMRDFGAVPPNSAYPFISSMKHFKPLCDPMLKNKLGVKTRLIRTPGGVPNTGAKAIFHTGQTGVPHGLFFDAGAVNNSFSIVTAYLDEESGFPCFDGFIEIMPIDGETPINFSSIYDDVLGPIIDNMNVQGVVSDRWQNMKFMSDIQRDFDIPAMAYSLKYPDFVTAKDDIIAGKMVFPYPETHWKKIESLATQEYPLGFTNKPVSHFLYQCLTVQDVQKAVIKGEGLTDDLFRAFVLGHYILTNDEYSDTFMSGHETIAQPSLGIVQSLGGGGGGSAAGAPQSQHGIVVSRNSG